MSKKYVAFIIGILTLLMAINCLGEGYSFSFRNGICFGENSDSVMSKEPKIYRDVSDPNLALIILIYFIILNMIN